MPTIVPLLRIAFHSAKQRAELFFLLTIFAGLLSSIVYSPALPAIFALMESSQEGAEVAELSAAITDQVPMLIASQLGLLVIAGFLLPLWSRASNPGSLIPWDGSANTLMRRGILGFLHQLTAAILTLLSWALIIMVAALLSTAGGAVGSLAILLAITFAIWTSVFFSAAANTAIISASTDIKMTFSDAINKNKPYIRPIIGSLAAIWFLSLALDMLLETLLTRLSDGAPNYVILAFLKGTLGFMVAALHINILYNIPGLFRTDRQA